MTISGIGLDVNTICGFEGIYLFIFLDSSMVEHSAVNRRVVGSSPTRGVFLYVRLRGQAVKTSPFHGGNTGSIPVGVICRCGSIGRAADL